MIPSKWRRMVLLVAWILAVSMSLGHAANEASFPGDGGDNNSLSGWRMTQGGESTPAPTPALQILLPPEGEHLIGVLMLCGSTPTTSSDGFTPIAGYRVQGLDLADEK